MSDRNQKLSFKCIGLWGLFDAGFAVLAAVTLLSFLGEYSWLLELASHFRVQYLVLLLSSAAVYALRKRFRGMAVALGIAAVCSPTLLAAYVPTDRSEGKGPIVKAMVMHVNPSDGKFDLALKLIRSEQPMFVVMEDVTPDWEAIMKRELSAMPNGRFISRNGMAFLSRQPWDGVENADISSWGFPGLKMSYSAPQLTVFAVHIPAPISATWRKERMRQFSRLAHAVKKAKGRASEYGASQSRPVLVLGDFNCSPWSPLFQQLLDETKLRDTRQGFGIKPTWPSITPPFLIPIDHVLVTNHHFQVIDLRVGPYIGSDHTPLIVTLRWARCCFSN